MAYYNPPRGEVCSSWLKRHRAIYLTRHKTPVGPDSPAHHAVPLGCHGRGTGGLLPSRRKALPSLRASASSKKTAVSRERGRN